MSRCSYGPMYIRQTDRQTDRQTGRRRHCIDSAPYGLFCKFIQYNLYILFVYISMGQYKEDVPALLTHWNYVFLALTHRYVRFHVTSTNH